jgi:hypothetical protein
MLRSARANHQPGRSGRGDQRERLFEREVSHPNDRFDSVADKLAKSSLALVNGSAGRLREKRPPPIASVPSALAVTPRARAPSGLVLVRLPFRRDVNMH